MYCIECGAQIPDNSKFCSHCGHKQSEGEPLLKEKIAEAIIAKGITRQVVEENKNSLNLEFLKKAMGWYLTWVLLHLGLLLICSNGIFNGNIMGARNFWPLGRGYFSEWHWGAIDLSYYDITEFLVYTLFPLAILFIWSMTRTRENELK